MGRRKYEMDPKSNQRLNSVMSRTGISGRALHKMTGVSETTISNIRNSKIALTPEIATLISGSLGVTADYLLGKSDTENLDRWTDEKLRYDQQLKKIYGSIESILREDGYTIDIDKKNKTVKIDYRFVSGRHHAKIMSLRKYRTMLNDLHNCIKQSMSMGFDLLEDERPDAKENIPSTIS